MASKSLAVLGKDGAGKKTLVGSLLYKCGLDPRQLQQLESGTDRKYVDIVPFFEENGMTKSFYAPSAKIVVEDTTTPNIAFWVVDASSPDRGTASSAELASLISAGSLKPNEKLLILLNKMDRVDWSERVFRETAKSFQAIDLKSTEAYIVPVSALRGDNILESPNNVPWIRESSPFDYAGPHITSERTLMQVLG